MGGKGFHHRFIPFPDISDSLGNNLRNMLLHVIPGQHIFPGESSRGVVCLCFQRYSVLVLLPGGSSSFARGFSSRRCAFRKELKSVYKDLFMVDLFTGMREGEICGLSCNQINFKEGTITISQQLQIDPQNREFVITSTKNGKSRIIRPAETVMQILQDRKREQFLDRQSAGDSWKNEWNLVFTQKDGCPVHPHSVYDAFKIIVNRIGCPDARFHDLRHSFATIALANGDDIKTVSDTLGHYAASFTLSVYGHSTDDMKKKRAVRMENFLNSIGVA